MRKYILLVFVSIVTIQNTYSQRNQEYDNGTWNTEIGAQSYIYTNTANIRDGIGLDTEIIDQLACGYEVTILEDTQKEETINNITAKWLKVSYQKEGTNKEGYLWQGTLSCNQLRRGDIKFVFGLDSFSEGSFIYNGNIKAVRGNTIISSCPYSVNAIASAGGCMVDQHGLSGVDNVIEIIFGGYACGITTTLNYFVWSDNKLQHMITTRAVSEASRYRYREILEFSTKRSTGDLIIKLIEVGRVDEDKEIDSILEMDWKFKTELYRWNGKKMILQDQNWKSE